MGVFGSSDGDQSKRLEADIAFIKTRLDLIARQLSGTKPGSDPGLDAKLHAIYRAISNVQTQQQAMHHAPAEQPPSHPASEPGPVHIEGLDELRADVRQLLSKSDRALHLDLTQRLDAIDARLEKQQATIGELTDALRSLVRELGNR